MLDIVRLWLVLTGAPLCVHARLELNWPVLKITIDSESMQMVMNSSQRPGPVVIITIHTPAPPGTGIIFDCNPSWVGPWAGLFIHVHLPHITTEPHTKTPISSHTSPRPPPVGHDKLARCVVVHFLVHAALGVLTTTNGEGER